MYGTTLQCRGSHPYHGIVASASVASNAEPMARAGGISARMDTEGLFSVY